MAARKKRDYLERIEIMRTELELLERRWERYGARHHEIIQRYEARILELQRKKHERSDD